MIIYAFYGLGKTTLCSEYPEQFVEVDEEYVLSDFSFDIKAIANHITALSRDRIVFINGKLFLIEGIEPDLAFIPENYEMIEKRLLSRGVGESFLNNLRRIYEDIIQDIRRKCKMVITVHEDNYLSQYVNMTEKKGEGNVKKKRLSELEEQKEKIEQRAAAIHNEATDIQSKMEALKKDILLNAIITGTDFTIRHGMVAPYSHGYYITSPHVQEGYCRTVTCSARWYQDIVDKLYTYLVDKQCWQTSDFEVLQEKVDTAWGEMPEYYNRNEYGPDNSLHGHHIANGYETDGFKNIVEGRCGGTYSSYTTGTQNDLARELCILRGYGADYYVKYQHVFRTLPLWLVEHVYRGNGLLSEGESLNEKWFAKNKSRCIM